MTGKHRSPELGDYSFRWTLIALLVAVSSIWTGIAAALTQSTWPMVFVLPHVIGFAFALSRSLKVNQ